MLKVVVSISIHTSSIRIHIISHLRQSLDLLKFLIFANVVGVKCYPVMYGFNLYSLITDNIKNLFIGFQRLFFLFVCFAMKRKCLFISLINFLCGHLLFSFVFANIFHEIVQCFFRCLSPSNKLKFLERKGCTFFIVISPAISIMIQLDSPLFCR